MNGGGGERKVYSLGCLSELLDVQLTQLLLIVDGINDWTDCVVEVGQSHDLGRGRRGKGVTATVDHTHTHTS